MWFLFYSSVVLYTVLSLASYVWLVIVGITLAKERDICRRYPDLPKAWLRGVVIVSASLVAAVGTTTLLWYTLMQLAKC